MRLELLNDELTIDLLEAGIQGPPGPAGGAGGAAYQTTVTNADLSIAGVLVVTHNLNSYPSALTIWNTSGEAIVPDRVEVASLNVLAIYLDSYAPLSGTWRIKIVQ